MGFNSGLKGLKTRAAVILDVMSVKDTNVTNTAESCQRHTYRMSTRCRLITLLTSDLLHWDISWLNDTNNATGKLMKFAVNIPLFKALAVFNKPVFQWIIKCPNKILTTHSTCRNTHIHTQKLYIYVYKLWRGYVASMIQEKISYKCWSENLNRSDHFVDLKINERVILTL